ncbi:MAG TPA: hypothetical protein PL085_11545 [Agriterribacter sp.]|uniref:hypothetical protein n=1 Tax=Agriterribacter sp. TaxID=2821509 RepID=UPI002C356250|nr:hypothetical protein [Agriterribacter sp.]HRQ17703.1 hypothetical protein [Agriterribacter sp.]
MASKNVPLVGLKNLYIGDIASDGGMGTGLTPVSYSVEGTPVLTFEEGEQTDFPIEESDNPYYVIKTPGNKTFTLSIYGINAATMYKHFGGVLTPGATSADPDVWAAPAQFPELEKSIVAEHKQGGYLAIVRAKLNVTAEWKFQKSGLPQLNIEAIILAPTKDGVAPFTLYHGGDYTP